MVTKNKKKKVTVKTEQELLGMTDKQYQQANSCANYTLIGFVVIAVFILCGLTFWLMVASL